MLSKQDGGESKHFETKKKILYAEESNVTFLHVFNVTSNVTNVSYTRTPFSQVTTRNVIYKINGDMCCSWVCSVDTRYKVVSRAQLSDTFRVTRAAQLRICVPSSYRCWLPSTLNAFVVNSRHAVESAISIVIFRFKTAATHVCRCRKAALSLQSLTISRTVEASFGIGRCGWLL